MRSERVAVVGSRRYPRESEVREFVRSLAGGSVVISGGARGVDAWAEDEARQCGLGVVVHRAHWERWGRRAGFIRNELIVAEADRVVAFWDGESRGTRHTIEVARAKGKPVEVRRSMKPVIVGEW